jgi:putative intracellular protease/amidase
MPALSQLFPASPAPTRSARLEVVGPDYTSFTPVRAPSCDPYYDPYCYPGGGGPNYGAGTSGFAQQHFVPHIVSGGGFVTLITITNLANTSNAGQLLYWAQNGATLSRTAFTLPPGATMRVQTAEADRFGPSSVQWLTVSSSYDVGINSFFELRDSSGKVLNTIGFNDPQEGMNFSVPVEFAPGAAGAVGHTVGLAIADDTSDAATLTLNLYDGNGKLLGTAFRSLTSFQQIAVDLTTMSEFSSVLPATDFVGTLAVTSDHVVSQIALEDDLGPFYSTPGITAPAYGQLVVPHMVSGGGFVTRLTLMNLDTVNNNFDVQIEDQSGKLLQEQKITVAPGGSARVSTGEAARFGPSQVSWAIVSATAAAAVNSFFELEDGTGKVVNTIGFNNAVPVTDFTVPVEFMPASGSVGRTVGIALANPSSTAATVTLKLVDSNANVIATTSVTLNANSQQAIDLSTIQAFQSALPSSDFVGVLAVNSSVPVATIALGDDFGPFYSTPVMAGRAR